MINFLRLACFLLSLNLFISLVEGEEKLEPDEGHPRASYLYYSKKEIKLQAEAVRQNRPQMHRGGWEWDRLLERYIDSERKDPNEIEILKAYLLSILDRYQEAKKNGKHESFTLFYNHKSWGSGGRMRIYDELVRQKLLSESEEKEFKELVLHSIKIDFPDYSLLERGVNNRPYGINAGPAIAVQMFPDDPVSVRHSKWLDALWRELVEYGDTTETNYYPYGPLYLHGLIDMAYGMNKFTTDRDFLKAHFQRYLYYIHGGGVRGNPNSSANIIQNQRDKIYADPWNAEYYGGAEKVNDGHVWYRLAKEFEDPEFLWASEQVCLGGRPPKGYKIPDEYLEAYQKRYFWFIKKGIEPSIPKGGSSIGYYSPLKHKIPERLYLCSSRESGKPFVSFFIYDRNNNYMHYCDDSDGKLYEYCVEGAKFLHTSGKYTSGRAGVGETAYDLLSVLPPDMKFPIKSGGGMDTPTGEAWKMSSMSIKLALNSREGPDSKNWKFDDKIQHFRRTDQKELGFSYGNMDGYWQLNNQYQLKSLRIGPFASGSKIQNLRISGPAGEKILESFNSLSEGMKVEIVNGEKRVPLNDNMKGHLCKIVDGGRRLGKCIEIGDLGEGNGISFIFNNLNEDFDAQNEFTRISYDFKGPSNGGITPNVRTNPRYFTPLWHRGAILVRDNLRAENKGEDSFGQFSMRNYYGSNSEWTRQSVLTAEGYLIVSDRYVPCLDVDGYVAGPCWSIASSEDIPVKGRQWFDAPARDHAWWQKKRKRVILHLHRQNGHEIGQVETRTSQDIGGAKVRNTFSKVTLTAGKPVVWLSVFRPYDEGQDKGQLASGIKTTVDESENVIAKVDDTTITINQKGEWSVKRN